MQKRCQNAISLILVLVLIGVLLLRAAQISQSALAAMQLSASVVVPSLFPMCVLATALVESGIAAAWRIPQLTNRLRLDAHCAPACILGALCGYPIGAAVLTRQYARREIPAENAERALAFCNNASPVFIVSVVGEKLFGSRRAGILLLATQLLSAALVALTLSPRKKAEKQEKGLSAKISFSGVFTDAVRSASLNMIQISGFIVLSSVLLCLLRPIFQLVTHSAFITALVSGSIEVTNGLSMLAESGCSLRMKFIAAAALLGWSGLCVHLQVLSFVSPAGLSAKKYLAGKLLQVCYSLMLAIPAVRLLPDAAAAFAPAAKHPAAIPVLLGWAFGFSVLFFYLLFGNMHSIIDSKRKRR